MSLSLSVAMSKTPGFTIAKLDVHPGDTVIFRLKEPIEPGVVLLLQHYLAPYMPKGVKALIVDHDTEVTVLSKPRRKA
jgi:hypothetical protein